MDVHADRWGNVLQGALGAQTLRHLCTGAGGMEDFSPYTRNVKVLLCSTIYKIVRLYEKEGALCHEQQRFKVKVRFNKFCV